MMGVFSTRTNESDRGVVATPSGGRYSPMANDRHIDWRKAVEITEVNVTETGNKNTTDPNVTINYY